MIFPPSFFDIMIHDYLLSHFPSETKMAGKEIIIRNLQSSNDKEAADESLKAYQEKFLQLFTIKAYASAFLACKKHIDYKHLCKSCSLPLSSCVLMRAKPSFIRLPIGIA
ncbi:hypothetical protein Tco_0417059 [Tanacetum coccineum]